MERPVLTRFFKNKGLKEVHESYLKSPELYAYAQSMDNYADWLEEKYNEACEGSQQPDAESKCNKHIVNGSAWTNDKVIDFVNWFMQVHELDFRYTLENQSLIDSFENGDSPEIWHCR